MSHAAWQEFAPIGENEPQPPTPETPPSPQALLRAHVEDVHQNGDVFDARYRYSLRNLGNAAIYGAALGIGISDSPPASVMSGLVAVGVAMIGAKTYRSMTANREQRSVEQRYNNQTKHALDADYELYKLANRPDGVSRISMHWYGSLGMGEDKTVLQHLQNVATLAKECDIHTVVVPFELVKDIDSSVGAGLCTTLQDWMRQNKHLTFRKNRAADRLIEATPRAWLSFTQHSKEPTQAITVYSKPSTTEIMHADWVRKQIGLDKDDMRQTLAAPGDAEEGEGLQATTVIIPNPQSLAANEALTPQEQYAVVLPLTESMSDRSHGLLRRRFRSVNAFSAFSAAFSAMVITQVALDEQYEAIEKYAAVSIASEQGVDPNAVTIDPGLVRSRIASLSGMNDLWGDWYDLRQNWPEKIADAARSKTSAVITPQESSQKIGGDVGNVGRPSTATAWNIDIIQGNPADITGHWVTGTSHSAIVQGTQLAWEMAVPTEAYWTASAPLAPEQDTADPDGSIDPLIQVSGQLGQEDFVNAPYESYAAIPVLEGYKVVAAALDGKSINLTRAEDGTVFITALQPQHGAGGTLQYWLQYDGTVGPRAIKATTIENLRVLENPAIDTTGAKNILERNIEGASMMSREDLAQSINQKLQYAYNPWPEDKLENIKELEDFVELTFAEGKANCNVANSLMAIHDNKLNMVFEFNNQRDPSQLTMNEAHARVVDGSGRTYDATPSSGTFEAASIPPPAPLPVAPIGIALAGLIAAGGALRYRRPIVSASIAAIAKRITGGTDWSSPQNLRETLAFSDHVLWSPQPGTIDPAYIRKAGTATAQTPSHVFALLKDSARHDVETMRQLKQLPGFTAAHRKALRIAKYAAKRATLPNNRQQ
jgi:hypothetical protein